MLATEEYVDLCTTCNDHTICITDSRRPVLFCEQFDDFTPEPEKALKPVPETRSSKAETDEPEDNKLLGLCINCDFRKTCPLAKKEGGVWHCEEYQ